jgi:hypothetical protein
MRARNVCGLMLAVILLLATGSGLAQGPQSTGPSAAAGANLSSVANAPWFKFEIDTDHDAGQYASVTLDPGRGRIYISHYDATAKELRVAYQGSGAGNCGPDNHWWCWTLDSGADVGKYSSIAATAATGGEGIAYYDATNGALKYALCVWPPCSEWPGYTIDRGIFPVSSAGLFSSLKYSPDGTPVIAYYFDNPSGVDALKVAHYVGGGGNCGYGDATGKWQCDTIQTGEGVGQHASLALDGAGKAHIAYYDRGNGDLWYATNRSGSNCGPGNTWTCYPVSGSTADVGQYASLYVDNANRFHIAYYDATVDKLKYAVDVGGGGNCGVLGSAQCDEIDAMQAGYHPLGVSMAQDAAGYPIIAYQSANGSLNVARPLAALGLPGGSGNCGPANPLSTWYCRTIDRSGTWVTYRNGDFVSVAVNSSGLATIAYYGFVTSSGGNLDVAYQQVQAMLPLVAKNQ